MHIRDRIKELRRVRAGDLKPRHMATRAIAVELEW
jgi:hypothetical protein